ncbi:unnamed protein product, partial [Discosporangium mesarthrocarpum]
GLLQHGALVGGNVLLLGAEIQDNKWDAIYESLICELHNAQCQGRGNNRTAARGERGHQKTPEFICALLRNVLRITPALPMGGFSDVGLHTGGQPRDTAWPLVKAVVQ